MQLPITDAFQHSSCTQNVPLNKLQNIVNIIHVIQKESQTVNVMYSNSRKFL